MKNCTKTPRAKQLYDVCEMLSYDISEVRSVTTILTRHIRTLHTNIPAAMASYYVKTLPKVQKGSFYMYVKNGLKPLDVLRERKLKSKEKCSRKMII